MKVYNSQTNTKLKDGLRQTLEQYRQKRKFQADDYVREKTKILNEYMRESGLKTCVVAVSGGIDSAVVLGLVHAAARRSHSPITRIIPLFLPVYNHGAATNQEDAFKKASELCATYNLQLRTIDLTKVHAAMKQTVDDTMQMVGEDWASGQLVAYTRTPAMYYVTSLCSQMNQPAIICGTTNYDEGGYLGYFGKASDGMVDVQLISDAHKSEVYRLADFLMVPVSILQAIPTGDMYDGRVDEEVLGASYDFVELYLYYLNLEKAEKTTLYQTWNSDEKAQFDQLAARLEQLHAYNSHKYIGRSPAVHLDILKSDVKGGWNNERI